MSTRDRDRVKERGELENGQTTPLLGQYQNVSLTDEQLAELKSELPSPSLYEKYIDKLSEYMASTGKTYNSHIATIRKWAKEDSEKNGPLLKTMNIMEIRAYKRKE